MSKVLPSEHAEQVAFVAEFERKYPDVRIFAIPNGGLRNAVVAQKLKQEGVKKGVPDLFIPAWNLWIEMKRQKGGRLSPEQKDWIEYLSANGYKCIVAPGAKAALTAVEEWHKLRTETGATK
jgi:hypothetical protein